MSNACSARGVVMCSTRACTKKPSSAPCAGTEKKKSMETQANKSPALQTTNNPTATELATLERMAGLLHRSGFCKGARTAEQAVALVLMGREVGLPAMQALSTIHVIEGKPTASVHLMGALLARGGVSWKPTKHDVDGCEIEFSRPGWQAITSSFTRRDAECAGLAKKDNWLKWPRAMYYARAFTEGARMIAPDLLCGLNYTPEELAPDTIVVDERGDAVVDKRDNGAVADSAVVDIARPFEDESQDPRDNEPIGPGRAGKLVAMAFAREEAMGAEKFACMRAVFHPLGAKSKAQIATLPASKFAELLTAIESWDPGRLPGEEG